MSNHKPSEYIATAKWHSSTGSFAYYVKAMQEKAARDNAPLDALYLKDGVWVCVSDLRPGHHFREWYEGLAK